LAPTGQGKRRRRKEGLKKFRPHRKSMIARADSRRGVERSEKTPEHPEEVLSAGGERGRDSNTWV